MQPNLFNPHPEADPAPDVCRNRHGGNPQSEAANLAIDPYKGSLRDRIFRLIEIAGLRGVTCEEIEVELALKHQSVSARISELAKDRLISDSGKRRENVSRVKATV